MSAAVVAALVGGALGLALARRAPAAAKKGKDAPPTTSSPCDELRKLGAPESAVIACKGLAAGSKLLGALVDLLPGEPDWTERDAVNRTLNGPVDLELPAALAARSIFSVRTIPTRSMALLRGGILRFKSGCTPFKGSPGWSRCAPGTHDMWRGDESSDTWARGPASPLFDPAAGPIPAGKVGGAARPLYRSQLFSQLAGDATTMGPFLATDGDFAFGWGNESGGRQRPAPKFPLPLGPGQWGWFLGGKPYVCAEGKVPMRVRDHRADGAEQWRTVCEGIGGGAPPPGSGAAHSERDSWDVPPSNPPDGYVWVFEPAPPHWERKRAGQRYVQDGPSSGHWETA